jgi:hypothetical protein
MSSFVVKENWEKRRAAERKNKFKKHKTNRINLDFLPTVGPITIHHEPPKFERRNSVEIATDHAGHATFHRLRFEMYGHHEDLEAYMGQTSLMNEKEAALEEKLRNSPKILGLIRKEIRRRGR